MLRIFVVSHNGIPPRSPMESYFDQSEGGIGRDPENQLMLPGQDKHLSRVQAVVKCLGGEYFLVDQGGNPSTVNGRPLGRGSVAALHAGDRIVMASWVLQVDEVAAGVELATGRQITGTARITQPVSPAPGARSGAGVALPVWGVPTGLEQNLRERPLSEPVADEYRAATISPVLAARAQQEDLDVIQAGLLKGLGLSRPQGWSLDSRQAEQIGALLRISMEGFLQLLKETSLSRQQMEVSEESSAGDIRNPLKISAEAAIALRRMLFEAPADNQMSPQMAVQDAVDELHAHHAGLFLGVRAALASMLEVFQPDHLVEQLHMAAESASAATDEGEWNTYMRHHDQIVRQARQSFHANLAKMFDRVYQDRRRRRSASRVFSNDQA